MAQRFVLRNRSKDADGHKEISHMIRDPRQRIANGQLDNKRTKNNKLIKIDSKKKNKGKMVTINDSGVRKRIMKKSSAKK